MSESPENGKFSPEISETETRQKELRRALHLLSKDGTPQGESRQAYYLSPTFLVGVVNALKRAGENTLSEQVVEAANTRSLVDARIPDTKDFIEAMEKFRTCSFEEFSGQQMEGIISAQAGHQLRKFMTPERASTQFGRATMRLIAAVDKIGASFIYAKQSYEFAKDDENARHMQEMIDKYEYDARTPEELDSKSKAKQEYKRDSFAQNQIDVLAAYDEVLEETNKRTENHVPTLEDIRKSIEKLLD